MSSPVEVYVPCDVFEARVRVGPEESSSPLEVLFMEAIHEGMTSFDALSDLFALGPRLTLDLVFDLWRRGYVVIDLSSGVLRLTEQSAAAAAAGELEKLALAQATEETWEVMQERLSGFVLPSVGPRSPKHQRAAVPADGYDTNINDISRDDLYAALRRIASQQRNGQRPIRVLSAHVGALQRRPEVSRRWLLLRILPTLDPDDGRVTVEVLDDGRLPLAVRIRMARALTRLAEDEPESGFVRYMLEGAEREAQRPFDIAQALASMSVEIDALPSLDKSLREQHQEVLCALSYEIEDWCNARFSPGLSAEVVVDLEAHLAIIKRLIGAARRQLVIACPWIRSRPFNAILDEFHAALSRGVQIFVLWGIGSDSVLDRDVMNAFRQLKEEFPLSFFASDRSSRTHAKVLIQDDRAALLTSCNFLSSTRASTLEVGVLVRPASGARGQPIEELLAWAREQYPEYLKAQALYTLRDDFHPAPEAGGENELAVVTPSLLDNPSDAGLDTALIRAWQASWRATHDELSRAVARTRDESAEVLRDGDHRTALRSAMRGAQARLLVASDQLGPEVVEEHFLRGLQDLLARGVHVAIIHRRRSEYLGAAGGDPTEQLEELGRAHPDRFTYISDADTHAKVVVADNWAVVSSFNFLSFEGFYEERAGSTRRNRAELGLRIAGGPRVDAILQAFASRFPDALGAFPPAPAEAGPSSAPRPLGAPHDVSAVVEALASAGDGHRLIAERIAQAEKPWELLEALAAVELPDTLLKVAVASCISNYCGGERDSAQRWTLWLAERAWCAQEYLEAAILRASVPDLPSDVVPRAQLLGVMAARGHPAFGEVAEEACLSDLGTPEKVALVALCVAELTVSGDPSAAEVADAERDALPAAWRDLSIAAADYWKATFEPLPMMAIASELDETKHRADLETRWTDLARALQEGSARNFGFASGKKTCSYLYRPAGPLGQLDEIVRERDPAAVEAWLATNDPDDLDEWLDDATRAATGRKDQLFHSGIRASYTALLSRIFSSAHRVGEASIASSGRRDEFRMAKAEAFAQELRRLWPALQGEAESLDGPVQHVLGVVLESLAPVRQWRAA